MRSMPAEDYDLLPTEYPIRQSLSAVMKRLLMILTVAVINAIMLIVMIGIQRLVTGMTFLVVGSASAIVSWVLLQRMLIVAAKPLPNRSVKQSPKQTTSFSVIDIMAVSLVAPLFGFMRDKGSEPDSEPTELHDGDKEDR